LEIKLPGLTQGEMLHLLQVWLANLCIVREKATCNTLYLDWEF